MSQPLRRRIIAFLLSILIALLSLELSLRMLDPWGARRMFDDFAVYWPEVRANTQRSYWLPPGTYSYPRGWQAMILSDGSRRVPATRPDARCVLVLLGDSVTFGWGLNDGDTWANDLAKALPDVRMINTGTNGYNTTDALHTLRTYPGVDAYLYFYVGNDTNAPFPWQRASQETGRQATITEYLYLAQGGDYQPDIDPGFWPAMDTLNALPNVLMVGWKDRTLQPTLAQRYPRSVWIDEHYTPLSYADRHPNKAGAQQIAERLLPAVRQFTRKWCDRL